MMWLDQKKETVSEITKLYIIIGPSHVLDIQSNGICPREFPISFSGRCGRERPTHILDIHLSNVIDIDEKPKFFRECL